MKYRIEKSDLFISNKIHPEGSEVELTKEQTKGIENFLIPLNSESHPEEVYAEQSRSIEGSQKKSKTKGNKK